MQTTTTFAPAAVPSGTKEDQDRFVRDGAWYTCVIV